MQRDYAECIQQISLWTPGCAALRAAAGVVEALDALVEQAWSDEAKECARGEREKTVVIFNFLTLFVSVPSLSTCRFKLSPFV